MPMLKIKAKVGSPERSRMGEEIIHQDISQTSLSYMLGVDRRELESIAMKHNIPLITRDVGRSGISAVFYGVENVPRLLKAIKEDLKATNEFEWFNEVQLDDDEFEIKLPSGSILQYKKS